MTGPTISKNKIPAKTTVLIKLLHCLEILMIPQPTSQFLPHLEEVDKIQLHFLLLLVISITAPTYAPPTFPIVLKTIYKTATIPALFKTDKES